MFRQIFLMFFVLSSFSCFAENNKEEYLRMQPSESLFLRRIVEYWEEGEMNIVKKQIHSYLEQNQKTPFANYLITLLADIYLTEKDFAKAKELYQQVDFVFLQNKILVNYLYCLHEKKDFAELIEKAQNYLQQQEQDPKVLFFIGDSFYQLGCSEENKEKLIFAKQIFENLAKDKVNEKALCYLANIYEKLKDYPAAYEMYMQLAKCQGEEEKNLLAAASMASFYDREKAIDLFQKIYALKKEKAAEAAYNLLLLTFEEKKYDALIQQAQGYLKELDTEQVALIRYILGKSYFQKQEYKKAAKELKRYLKIEDKTAKQMRSALALIMQCGQKLDDFSLFSYGFSHFVSYFPQDEEIVKALYMKALFHKKRKDTAQAIGIFVKIQKEYPSFNEKMFLFEYAHALYQKQQYEQAINLLEKEVEKASDLATKALFLRLLVNCDIQLKNDKKDSFCYQRLKNHITCLFDVDNLEEKEKKDLSLMLLQLQMEQEEHDLALEWAQYLLQEKIAEEQKDKIYFAIALCYKEGKKDISNFCHFAEKAIEASSENNPHMHLALFNAYLERKEEEQLWQEKAADHLFTAQKTISLSMENLLWLGQYFHDKQEASQDRAKIYEDKAVAVLQKILAMQDGEASFPKEKFLVYEKALSLLVNLLHREENTTEKLEILQKMVSFYEQHQDVEWKCKKDILLTYANILQQMQQKDEALQYYEKIQNLFPCTTPSYFASLYRIRLLVDKMSQEEKQISHPLMITYLNELKNLKNQKRLQSEPVHMEAALDYIDLRLQLEKEETIDKRLSLLENVQKEFTETNDLISRDYHNSREKDPHRNKLYLSYMLLIQMQMHCCKYLLQKEEEHLQQAQKCYETLQQEDMLHTAYLDEKVKQYIQLINFEKK